MIGIVDYGLGNIRSVMNAVEFCTGTPCTLIDRPEDLQKASRLILPGVGAFGEAMETISRLGLDRGIREAVQKGIPILGICLGMQLLATRSHEFGVTPGLDLIPGEIHPLETKASGMRIPHMGWNNVRQTGEDGLFRGIRDGADFYFAHSFYFAPDSTDHGIGTSEYGDVFVSAVGYKNIYGVQFHPEKSQAAGLMLLKNFAGPGASC